MTGVSGWAHCSPGLGHCSDGVCHPQAHPLHFALPAWQVAQLLSPCPDCHLCWTFPCRQCHSRAQPSSHPPRGFFGGSGEKLIPDPVPLRLTLISGDYLLILPVLSPAFAGFPAQPPAACTLSLNSRLEISLRKTGTISLGFT